MDPSVSCIIAGMVLVSCGFGGGVSTTGSLPKPFPVDPFFFFFASSATHEGDDDDAIFVCEGVTKLETDDADKSSAKQIDRFFILLFLIKSIVVVGKI
jgi:hypothetical protein